MNAIIVCGGLSTRLGSITKDIPKVLLPIQGKTVLEWQLDKIKKLGIDTVVLAAGHLSHILQAAVGHQLAGVNIIYSIEPELLGTGGAIKHAWQQLPNPAAPVVIFNGDILTTVDLPNMRSYLRPGSHGIILGSKVEDASSYGKLDFDDHYRLRVFKEKEGRAEAGFINGGLYIFNQRVADLFPPHDKFSIEYDVFPRMDDVDVYTSDKPWIDVGVPERLRWAQDNWEE